MRAVSLCKVSSGQPGEDISSKGGGLRNNAACEWSSFLLPVVPALEERFHFRHVLRRSPVRSVNVVGVGHDHVQHRGFVDHVGHCRAGFTNPGCVGRSISIKRGPVALIFYTGGKQARPLTTDGCCVERQVVLL